MGDDGVSGVNLGFSFPYYDKSFNQAYMHDNGVLSFLQPGTPDAMSPWQWNSQPLDQTAAKYFIAPLWADIAPVAQTTYTTSGTASSQKFTWNNIAEYYSRGEVLRLNTFSVEINANGDIATKYFGLNLRTSNFSIGYKGNTDYTQVAYSSYGAVLTTQADWTANTKVTVAPPPAPIPVKQEPLPEPVIEQPVQEVVQETTQPAPVATAAPTVQAAAPTAAPTPAAVQQVVVVEPVKTETKKTAVKAQQVDMSVVDAAVAIAMTSATQSVNEQTNTSVQAVQPVVSISQRQNETATTSSNMSLTDRNVQQTMQNEKKDALELFIASETEKQIKQQEYTEKTVNKNVVANTELGPQIPGFSLYATLVLPDTAFYAPKQVYRNQKVVDNQRLLRSLNNDKKYTEMLDGQYR